MAARVAAGNHTEVLGDRFFIGIDRKKLRLEEPIRETGTYMVDVEVGGGVTASVKTIVAELREGPKG